MNTTDKFNYWKKKIAVCKTDKGLMSRTWKILMQNNKKKTEAQA